MRESCLHLIRVHFSSVEFFFTALFFHLFIHLITAFFYGRCFFAIIYFFSVDSCYVVFGMDLINRAKRKSVEASNSKWYFNWKCALWSNAWVLLHGWPISHAPKKSIVLKLNVEPVDAVWARVWVWRYWTTVVKSCDATFSESLLLASYAPLLLWCTEITSSHGMSQPTDCSLFSHLVWPGDLWFFFQFDVEVVSCVSVSYAYMFFLSVLFIWKIIQAP